MARIYDGYAVDTRLNSADRFIKDHDTNGTKTITAKDLAVELAGLVSAVQHRNVYRGKDLGTSITDAQKAAISAGTFDDLFIGDYWTINGTRYDIADMDYFYQVGDTALTRHHLLMMPHTNLYTAKMNETNTTEGGYTGSEMYTTNLDEAKNKITAAFGDLLITHREYLSNAVTDGHVSGRVWFDSVAEIPSEIMVYGSQIYNSYGDGSVVPNLSTTSKQQLALFSLIPITKQAGRGGFWLRDVVSSARFASVDGSGGAHYSYASNSRGVRPYFLIG